MITKYLTKIQEKINYLNSNELSNIKKASDIVAKTTLNKGLVYIFGSGHSSIMATELFYRPGGLLNIYPIFYEPLMVHQGPLRSSLLERDSKILKQFLPNYAINKEDCLIIISTSGINPVPIDLAIHFKKAGAKIIVISSKNYYLTSKSRHQSGKFLIDFANVLIDNNINLGDVVLEHKNYHFGSLSTIIGCTIVNSITAEAIKKIIDQQNEVDIIISGNTPGGVEHNKKLVKKYQKQIKCLK